MSESTTEQTFDYYVSSTNGDDANNGQSSDVAFKTIQKAIEAAAANTTDGVKQISVAAGEYKEDLTINNSITIIGESGALDNLTTKIAGADSSKSNTISITNTSGADISITLKDLSITHTDAKAWNVEDRAVNNDAAVSLEPSAHNINLSVTNCSISSTGVSNRATALNIFTDSNVNISNSKIFAEYYGIHVDLHPTVAIGSDITADILDSFSSGANPTLTITNSSVDTYTALTNDKYPIYLRSGANYTININNNSNVIGWCALYTKPGFIASTINVENSNLIGMNNYAGTSNDFGVVVIEDPNNYSDASNYSSRNGKNNEINIKSGSTISNYLPNVSNYYKNQEYPIVFNSYSQYVSNQNSLCNITKNTSVVNIEDSTLALGDNLTKNFINQNQNNTNNYENIKLTGNVEFEYVNGEDTSKAPLIYGILDDKEVFKNASSTIQSAIDLAENGDIIRLPAGIYTENLTINNNITISGVAESSESYSTQIVGKISVTAIGAVTLENLNLTYVSTTNDLQAVVELNAAGNLTIQNAIITPNIQSNGNYCSGVLISEDNSGAKLTINNTTIHADGDGGRGVAIRSLGSITTISDSTITANGGKYGSAIHMNTQNSANSATLNISNSTITAQKYYGIYLHMGTFTINITDNSKVSGFAALYLKPDCINSTVNISKSELVGIMQYGGTSNNFGTIAFEGVNNTINIKDNSIITNKYISGGECREYLILYSNYRSNGADPTAKDNSVIADSSVKFINTNIEKSPVWISYNGNSNSISADDAQFLYVADESSKPAPIVLKDKSGQVKNAVSTFTDALYLLDDEDIIEIAANTEYDSLVVPGIGISFSIVGNNSTIKGLSLAVASEKTVNISISEVNFTEKGLFISGANNVTITNCTFTDISSGFETTDLVGISTNMYHPTAIHVQNSSGKVLIEDTTINEVGGGKEVNKKFMGISITNLKNNTNTSSIEIKDNDILNVDHNAVYIFGKYSTISITDGNKISEWDKNNDSIDTVQDKNFAGGRAVRLDVTCENIIILDNSFIKNYLKTSDQDAVIFGSDLGDSTAESNIGYDDGNILKTNANAEFKNNILVLSGIDTYDYANLFIIGSNENKKMVTFNPNGGYYYTSSEPGVLCSIVAANDTVSKPTDPSRSGSYSFNGWYDAATGGNKLTLPLSITADTTLYANWTYTGGSGVPVTPPTDPEEPVVKEEEIENEDGTISSITETTVTKENDDGSKETIVEKEEVVKDKDGNVQSVIEEKQSEVVNKDGSTNKTSEKVVKDKDGKVIEEKTEIEIEDKNTGVSTSVEITKGSDGKAASEITTQTSVETKDGKAQVSSEVLNEALKQAEAAKKAAEEKGAKDAKPVIEIEAENSEDFTETEISTEDLSKLAEAEVDVKIKTATGEVNIPPEVSKNLSSNADEKVSLSFGEADKQKLTEEQKKTVGDAPVFEFNLKSGEKDIHDLGGTVKVTVPYELKAGEDPNKITVWYIDEEGNPVAMNSVYDPETKSITFETSHFSYYFIAEDTSIPNDKKDDNNTIYYAVAAVIVILIIIALAYYFMKKKQ